MAQGVTPFLGSFLTDMVLPETTKKDHVDVSEPGAGRAATRTSGGQSPALNIYASALSNLLSCEPHRRPCELGHQAHLTHE